MTNLKHYWIVGAAAILTVLHTGQANADPVTIEASAGGISELTARWMHPTRHEAADMTAEDRIAAAIGLMISGGQRDTLAGSGGYHTDPAELRNGPVVLRGGGAN